MQIDTFDKILHYLRTTIFKISHDKNDRWLPKIHDIAPIHYPWPPYNFNEYFWFEVNLIEIETRFNNLGLSLVDIFTDISDSDSDSDSVIEINFNHLYEQMKWFIYSFGHSDYMNPDNIKLLHKLFMISPDSRIIVKNDYICIKWPDSIYKYYFDRNGDKAKLRSFTHHNNIYMHSCEIDRTALIEKYQNSEQLYTLSKIFVYDKEYPEVLIDKLISTYQFSNNNCFVGSASTAAFV